MSASTGLLGLFTPKGAVPGTGLIPLLVIAQDSLGPLPPLLVSQITPELNGLFGDYPSPNDRTPSAIMVGLHALVLLGHLFVFGRNWMRGHRFYISLALALYCAFMIIGFGMRIQWAKDVMQIRLGIASTVFTQVPILLLNVVCMYLGNRIFAWLHPETHRAWWFRVFVHTIYSLVVGVVLMAVVAQAVPFIYFLGPSHLAMCHKVACVAAILNTLYAFAGVQTIIFGFSFKCGTIDHRLWGVPPKTQQDLPTTFQPTWLEDFGLFYYPAKGSQRRLPDGAIATMPSGRAVADGFTRELNDYSMRTRPRDERHPRIVSAVFIVVICSVLLSVACCFRAPSLFNLKQRGGDPILRTPYSSFLYKSWPLYVFYGGFGLLVNVILLVTRIDLRFYIPDRIFRNAVPAQVPGDYDTVSHNHFEEPKADL